MRLRLSSWETISFRFNKPSGVMLMLSSSSLTVTLPFAMPSVRAFRMAWMLSRFCSDSWRKLFFLLFISPSLSSAGSEGSCQFKDLSVGVVTADTNHLSVRFDNGDGH